MRFLLILLLIPGIPNTSNLLEWAKDSVAQEVKFDTAPAPKPLSFSEEKMASFKKDPAFHYSEEETPLNWWTKFKRYVSLQYHNFLEWLFGDYAASGFLLFFIKSIPYLIIGAVLYLAIWLFNKMNPGAILLKDSHPGRVFLSEEEEIINSQNISKLIKKALEQKNYRLAIRYKYLLILRQLTEKGIISYEFSKTDEDYAREIKQSHLQVQFLKLTRIYDFIWYGNFEAREEHYRRIEREFEKMQELTKEGNEQNL